MRDLLKAAETVVDEYRGVPTPCFHALLAKLEEAIAATKARSEWVPVAERLPVVPEGEYSAAFWICGDLRRVRAIRIFKHETETELTALLRNYTHYMPRQDDKPAPPEDV